MFRSALNMLRAQLCYGVWACEECCQENIDQIGLARKSYVNNNYKYFKEHYIKVL